MTRFLRLTFAAALLGFAGRALADETPAMEAYGAGVARLQQRDWKGAESEFKTAVKLKTDYAEAYDKLGQSLFNQGKVFDAVTQFKHATTIDPRFTEAWYDLGFGFENLDTEKKLKDDEKTRKKLLRTEFDDAIAAYRKALEVVPSNDINSQANAQYRLGVLLRDEAMRAWALAHPDDATATAAVDQPTLEKANLKEAMLHLEAANALNMDFPENRRELGRL